MDKKMKKAIQAAGSAILIIILLDLVILFFAMGQTALEGRTGYWSPFWRWQAEQVLRLGR